MTDDESRLPPILAFGDVLDRIEAATDDPAAREWLADVREGHERVAQRSPDQRESAVNDLENLVEALRTHVDGEADRWVQTLQYRLSTYREMGRVASETLHLAGQTLEGPDGDPVDVSTYVGEAALTGTLVNQGERADATLQLAFYDADGVPTWKVESRQFDLEPGERRSFDMTVYVPEGIEYYAAVALDAVDPKAVAGDAPRRGR